MWYDADDPCEGEDVLLTGGYSQLVKAAARNLYGVILLQHNVTRIRYNARNSRCGCGGSCQCSCSGRSSTHVIVDVMTPAGAATYCSEQVVVTFPLGVLKAHADSLFDPPLPAAKLAAISSLGVGLLDKVSRGWAMLQLQ